MEAVPLDKVWAKTDAASRLPVVCLLTHSVNVGAVAREIVARLSPAARVFPAATWRGLASLAALHDIGKASPGFLQKCQAWTNERAPDPATSRDWLTREKNHAVVSHLILGKRFGHASMTGYAVAVGGHHGTFTWGKQLCPGGSTQARAMEHEYRDAVFQTARQDLLARLLNEDVFGPLPAEPLPCRRNDEAAAVVFLTGFITLADWIGSDEAFFPLSDPTPGDEKATLLGASRRAQAALDGICWGKTDPVPAQSFPQLFRAPDGAPYTPNALQRTLAETTRAAGLYIVEAPMGFGKTEAALHAAYLRWTQGGERGLYFALPTQVTSDRIFERLDPFLQRAIRDPSVATLVHGSAWLKEKRAIEIYPAAPGGDAPENAADARQWFASGRGRCWLRSARARSTKRSWACCPRNTAACACSR